MEPSDIGVVFEVSQLLLEGLTIHTEHRPWLHDIICNLGGTTPVIANFCPFSPNTLIECTPRPLLQSRGMDSKKMDYLLLDVSIKVRLALCSVN